MKLERRLLFVFGVLVSLLALVLLAAGVALIWADSERDEDGFFTTSTEQIETRSFALASKDLDIASDGPRWLLHPDIRLTATSNDPGEDIFIGIGRQADVAAYLDGVDHDVVTDIGYDPYSAD